jgi:2,4-dienoyl-CoA reductase-like NADH-dependent reductase (Old Yellow Enzyme family)/thioredoxin reductase
MTKLTKLFETGRIGEMELRNRLIMAPMGTFTADRDGYITQQTIDHYVERAKGGVGLIISQATCCIPGALPPSRAFFNDDKYIPMQKKLADAVHAHGARMATQLVHFGSVLASCLHETDHPETIDVLSASAIPSARSNVVPRAASKKDIDFLVENFSEAARRVKDAGFDAVEFHGAHGYLISEFLSPRSNIRTDEYGGSPEKRARFACEIISSTRRKVGPDFPIILRFSGSDFLEGGINISDVLRQAPLFVQAGANALHVSASVGESTQWQFLCYLYPSGAITHLAQAVKKVVDVPVITVGKIGDPVLANRIIQEGKADFVAMGRALLADPELPNKAKDGRFEDIRRCIYCNLCLSAPELRTQAGRRIRCTVNPDLLRQGYRINTPTSPKKVMVIGGGLAGMEAARVLIERGHQVSLYERSDRLGGQWNIAIRQEGKEGFASLTSYLTRELDKFKANIIFKKEVTLDFVREINPEIVVVATGAIPASLDISGANRKNVVQAVDIITGDVSVGERVIVVGGRYVGMELAISLDRQGKQVSLVTRRRLGRDVERNVFLTLRQALVDSGVHIYTDSEVYEITEHGVYINQYQELYFLKADTVVLAVGSKAETRLAEELQQANYTVYKIGDCVEPRDAREAIHEGHRISSMI